MPSVGIDKQTKPQVECTALEEAKARAEQAKEYVVKAHGIDSHRITTIDGGHRGEMLIELNIRALGLPPPLTFSSTYPDNTQRRKVRR